MQKKVLIVSFHFAPQNVIGAVRPTKLAKYLARMGYDVTVFCGKGYTASRDPILARDLAELTDVHTVRERSLFRWWRERGLTAATAPALVERARLPEQGMSEEAMRTQAAIADAQNRRTAQPASPTAASKYRPTQPVKQAAPQAQGRLHRFLDKLYIWLAHQADNAFARACVREAYALGQHYDIVLSTYGPLSSHTVARKLKQMKLADRWIADFRDEATVPFAWQKQRLTRYLRNVRRHADAITGVSLGFLQMMRLDAFGRVVSNGFDREDLRGLTPFSVEPDALTFAYCGQIHEGSSDLSPVFQALRALMDAGECQENRVRVHYAGKQGDVLARQAAAYGLRAVVVDHGMLSRADSLALQQAVDVLLVATWNTSARRGVMTGKLLEYLMANKPILCCVSGELKDSEVAQLLARTQAGIAWEQAHADRDTPRLLRYLRSIAAARFGGGTLLYLPDEAAVEALDYRHIAREFAEIIDNV